MISALDDRLIELVERIFPAWTKIGYEQHSDQSYTLWIMDHEQVWHFWRASLSLDDRWTLSPVY